MTDQNDIETAREIGEISAKLDTVIKNQEGSRERQHQHANEIQAMRYELKQQGAKIAELQPQVAGIVKRLHFWDTVIWVLKWMFYSAIGFFGAAWAFGKEVFSLFQSLKG